MRQKFYLSVVVLLTIFGLRGLAQNTTQTPRKEGDLWFEPTKWEENLNLKRQRLKVIRDLKKG